MEPTVLVPLRADGKSRLAPLLTPGDRRALARAMASDVVDALRGAGLGRIVLVAGGPGAREVGGALGLEVLDDPPGTVGTTDPDPTDPDPTDPDPTDPDPTDRAPALDRALSHAGRTVGGPTLIVAADLPALTADDVRAVLAAAADVVVAPTRGGGTAALLRRGDAAIAPAYGVDSAARHAAAARSAGLTVAVIERAGLAHDVDRPEDLTPPVGLAFGSATTRLLTELGARLGDG